MPQKRSTLEAHARTLAEVPPKEFVRARNTLANELKASDPKLAREVRALHRPSPSVWALGHVARHEHEIVARYLDAAARLRRVQTGRTKDGDLGEAIRLEREARRTLAKHADAALQKAGIHVTPTLRRQLLDTALAAATGDEETRDAFSAGALRGDLSPVRDLADLGLSTKLRAVPLPKEPAARASAPRAEKPRLRLVHATPTREQQASARRIAREKKRVELEEERATKRTAAAARKAEAAAHAHAVEEARAALRSAEAQAKAAQAEVARQRAALAAARPKRPRN
jgi:hypothetical protein